MSSWQFISRFLADERGAESVEFGLVGVVVAGGSVQGMLRVQAAIDARVEMAVAEILSAE
jgi:Flp pilus assembly pilin Flp